MVGVESSRAVRAAVIVVVLFVALGLSSLASSCGKNSSVPGNMSDGVNAAAVLCGGNPYDVLSSIESRVSERGASLAGSFLEEVGLPSGCYDVLADSVGSVVGCTVDGDSSRIWEEVQEAMREKGWSCVSLGGLEGATFVKDGGEIQWVLVTCTQIGEGASVVYRLRS